MSDFITNAELRIEAERLCDENDRLKNDNANLRILCASAYKCARHSDHATCDDCTGLFGGCTLKSAMREAGIEVVE